METNEVEERKKPSLFLLFSIVLVCCLAILNLIIAATGKWSCRKYEFALIIWLSVVGICEGIAIIIYAIRKRKQKRNYPYVIAGMTSGCTLCTSLLILIEFLLYYTHNIEELWNSAITYTLNVLALFIGLANISLFVFYIFYFKKNQQNL